MIPVAASLVVLAWLQLNVKFPDSPMAHVELVLRWIHFVAGIIWVGLLYFFNLVNVPLMKELDAGTKGKLVPRLMPRVLWWFRWGGVVTVLAGLLYFWIFLRTDANNAGDPALAWRWLGIWLAVWLVSYAIIFLILQAGKGGTINGWAVAGLISFLVIATGWLVLSLLAHPGISNKSLSISVGGGLGLVMLLNVWGVIWRAQKKIIAWTQDNAEQGTPMPPESAQLARWAFLASRANFWLSFPMLFFMAASSHYPFLTGH